jgi:hypothetical protein
MNSTTETANENFITDHGSIRLRFSRARRGPRAAADATVDRAARTVSVTRAAPTAAEPAIPPGRLPPPAGALPGRCGAAPGLPCGMTPGRPGAPDGEPPLPLVTIGTVADPFATAGPAGRLGSDEPSLSAAGSPGGGAMPGARVNFGGDPASAETAARPAASRPAGAAPSVLVSWSAGVVEGPDLPDFAVVSVIN